MEQVLAVIRQTVLEGHLGTRAEKLTKQVAELTQAKVKAKRREADLLARVERETRKSKRMQD